MATIYQCEHRFTGSTSQCVTSNTGKRTRCKGCGGRIRTITGHAVLIEHRGDNHYSVADAVREFATMGAAERAAAKAYDVDNTSTLVARFLIV